jgi:hypothetical protein
LSCRMNLCWRVKILREFLSYSAYSSYLRVL